MRYLIYFLAITLTGYSTATAQKTKPKAKSSNGAPTQAEMNRMMKEAEGMMQEMMNEMSPEDKKLMDSMGIKMPDMKKAAKNLPAASDKQLAAAWEEETRIVPKKNTARIASMAKAVTDARMPTYIAAIQKKLMESMTPEMLGKRNKVYDYIRKNSSNSSEAGIIATGFWIGGKPELALYLLGRVCTDDPKNTDNLSNYAAMLSMQDGQHLAIPVLNNLNAKFPKNSTLLNNLGQAWFGLGDIDKAGKYLDSATALYPFHAQANLTKSLIKESKGDKKGAIECLKKSIANAYTKEKEDRLNKLGYKLSADDIKMPYKPEPDPLGLEKTKRPEYPFSVSEVRALLPAWEQFNAECDAMIEKLQKELQEATERYAKSTQAMAMQTMAVVHNGGSIPSFAKEPIYARKAGLALTNRLKYYETKFKQMSDEHVQLYNDLEAIRKNEQRPPADAPCYVHRAATDKLIKKLNERKKTYDEDVLKTFRLFYNEMAFYARFTSIDEDMFNMVILPHKIEWLSKNREYQPVDMSVYKLAYLDCTEDEKGKRLGKLADFDDVGCEIRDTTDLVVWKFYTTCTKLIGKLDLKVIEYTRYDNFEREEGDTYVESSLKISVEKGIDKLTGTAGPLKAEAKIGASVQFEFDRSGVKDVIVSAEAKANAGANLPEEHADGSPGISGNLGGNDAVDGSVVEVGVKGQISLISGKGSITGSSPLGSIKLADW